MYMYSVYMYAYATRVERNCDDLRRARIPAKPTKKSGKKNEKRTEKKRNRKKGNRGANGIRKEKKRKEKKRKRLRQEYGGELFKILGRMNLVFCKRETREYCIF